MKKKILIFGSSKNLGKFLSKKFSKQHSVIKLSSTLKSNNSNIFNVDVTNEVSLNSTLSIIKKKINNINAIIFTVGNSKMSEGNLENFKQSFESNFFSFVNLINSYLKIFSGKKVKIIVISSIAGLKSIDAPVEYSVAKSALIFYSKLISKKLIKKGISINIISPGNILMKNNNWSNKIKINKKKVFNYIKKNVPSENFVKPEEIFNICELIISNKNVNLIGSNIVIDGGQSI